MPEKLLNISICTVACLQLRAREIAAEQSLLQDLVHLADLASNCSTGWTFQEFQKDICGGYPSEGRGAVITWLCTAGAF